MTWAPASPCAACGACCRAYIVPVCGHDVWRICRGQHLSPEQFLIPCPQEQPEGDGFRLEREGKTYALALDKQGRLVKTQPCVFLVDLPGGGGKCGIYADRPIVCQTYPMSLMQGVVFERTKTQCPPGSWSPHAPKDPVWRTRLQRLHLRYDVYAEVVARWNARVELDTTGAVLTFFEYFGYVLNVYDRLTALDSILGEDTVSAVEASWPGIPRPDDPAELPLREPGPWLSYFKEVRRLLDQVFPRVPPLEPVTLCTLDSLIAAPDLV